MPAPKVDTNGAAAARPSFWDEKPLLQKIVSIAPNILYVFNHKTQSNEFINNSLGPSMGYTAEEIHAMGADFMPMVCHPEDLPKVQAYFSTLHLMQDGDVSQMEYRMRRKDGQWRWMLSHDAIFDRDEDGSVLRLIGVASDITDRKEAEEAARAEKRAADAANEELRTFAYSVSHDMKAPTNTLQLLLTELQQQHGAQLPDDARQLVEMSIDMTRKMQNLVDDVLAYTRIIGADSALEDVPLAPLVALVESNLAADIAQTGATIEVGDLPVVRGVTIQLQAYLQNMISNALKYRRPDCAPLVRIYQGGPAADGRISITVSDNGIGISPSDQTRIFGMFKRLHLDDDIAGTGLGLALCQRVALNHGGQITLTSTPGEGSTFALDLEKS